MHLGPSQSVPVSSYRALLHLFLPQVWDSRRLSASGPHYLHRQTLTSSCFSTSCRKAAPHGAAALRCAGEGYNSKREITHKPNTHTHTSLSRRGENAESRSEALLTSGQGHVRQPHHLKAVLSSCLGKLSEMSKGLFLGNPDPFFWFFPGVAMWSEGKNQFLSSSDQLVLFPSQQPRLFRLDVEHLMDSRGNEDFLTPPGERLCGS